MPNDRVLNNLDLPKIPDNLPDEVREYLDALHQTLEENLTGTVFISGDLHVGGTVYDNENAS